MLIQGVPQMRGYYKKVTTHVIITLTRIFINNFCKLNIPYTYIFY